MGISRRLFESRLHWLNRVMHIQDVHFAIATPLDKDSDAAPLLVFLEEFRQGENTVSAHRINSGPEIGRWILKDEKEITRYDFKFHTRKLNSHVKGLVYSPDIESTCLLLKDLIACVSQLKDHQGIHVFTDPNQNKWFVTNETNETDAFRMWTRDKDNHLRGGWMDRNLLDQYGGEWHLHRLSLAHQELVNTSYVSSKVSAQPVPTALAKQYTLTPSTASDDVAVTSVIPYVKSQYQLGTRSTYELTLHVENLLEANQVCNIQGLLQDIVTTEALGATRINLDNIIFDFGNGKRVRGGMLVTLGIDQYYYTDTLKRNTFTTVSKRFPMEF